jgi:hypothetical protein
MAGQDTKAMMRGRSVAQKRHGRSQGRRKTLAAKRARVKRTRALVQARRAPRISRAKLRMIREELEGTRNTVTDAVQDFWMTPEGDIRETLARTQQKIGRAVDALKRAA